MNYRLLKKKILLFVYFQPQLETNVSDAMHSVIIRLHFQYPGHNHVTLILVVRDFSPAHPSHLRTTSHNM